MTRKIEISHRTIIFTVFFLIFVWFLYYISEIILIFFISLLITAILNPTVTKLSKFKIPRAVSVLVVYFIVIGIVVLAIAGLVPALLEQTASFTNNLPKYFANIGISDVVSEKVISELLTQLAKLPAQIVKFSLSIFSNVLELLTILIFAFYLLMGRDKIDDQLALFFGEKKKKEIGRVINQLELKLGGWARGELSLMLIIAVLTFVGLTLLKIPYALPLSLLAGILEIVPNIGPIISAIPGVLIGFGISPITGFATLALYFLVQQLENYMFVPKIMEKSVGVSPIITLLALAIGFKLAGIMGVLISVPVLITLEVLYKEYFFKKG
jgi:predicted PurR-regulated permease PerM